MPRFPADVLGTFVAGCILLLQVVQSMNKQTSTNRASHMHSFLRMRASNSPAFVWHFFFRLVQWYVSFVWMCWKRRNRKKKKRLGTMVCEFLRSVRLVSSFSSLLHCWKPFYQSWVQCVLLITPWNNAFVLFFFSFPVLFRMSYVFTRYSSISFFVVGIAPNKETFVSVTNALFWMIWLLVWHLCCSNALLVCRWFTFPTS